MIVINQDFSPEEFERLMHYVKTGQLIAGRWKVEAWESAAHQRDGQSPMLQWEFPNGITDLGIHHVLDRFTDFSSPEATLAPWYAGLINASGFMGVDPGDTMTSHTGWTESTDYSESVRQTLNFGAAATRTISDSVSFSINTTVTIQGLFVTSNNTKGGTTGTLFSTAEFTSPPALVNGNTLTANYSLSD